MMVQQLFCNHCGDLCRHIYFKCLQCPSYTICQLCVQDSDIRSKHSPENHMFFGEPQTSYRAETPSCKGCLRDVSQMRHKCLECSSYDLCDQCYPVLGRDHGHGFAKVTSPWDVFFHGPALFLENSKNLDSNIRCDICQGGFDQGSYFLRVRRNAPSDKICTTCEASADKPELREYPLVKIRTKLSFYTASSNSKPPAGAFCDVCSTSIFGERYKCVDCPDYDMCGSCLVKQRSRHTAAHRFIEVNRRCNICKEAIIGISYRCKLCLDGAGQVHDFCSDCAFGPNNTHAASHPAVAPLSTLVCFGPSSNIRPQLHEPGSQNTIHIGIRCDLCNTSDIKGLRMKCLDCHDFDTCATCFRRTPWLHPTHRFVKISKPSDIENNHTREISLHQAFCDGCDKQIIGRRFKCVHPECPDFDLCQNCESSPFSMHPSNHALVMSGSSSGNFNLALVAALARKAIYSPPGQTLSSQTGGLGQTERADNTQDGNPPSSETDCVVCQDARPVMANIECGHLCLCETCAREPLNGCPICRVPMGRLIRIYR